MAYSRASKESSCWVQDCLHLKNLWFSCPYNIWHYPFTLGEQHKQLYKKEIVHKLHIIIGTLSFDHFKNTQSTLAHVRTYQIPELELQETMTVYVVEMDFCKMWFTVTTQHCKTRWHGHTNLPQSKSKINLKWKVHAHLDCTWWSSWPRWVVAICRKLLFLVGWFENLKWAH